jgi:hypothetical protein
MRVAFCAFEETPLVAAARAGVESAGGEAVSWDATDPLDAGAFLFSFPAVLFGLPGDYKARIDAWLEQLSRGTLIPRTAEKPAGFLCTYQPNDDAIGSSVETQMRGIFGYLGMVFRGCACGPAVAPLEAVARRLGTVLATNHGFAGWPSEYRRGLELFNEEEFWEAHEVWEDLWIREETDIKRFYQGLIQVASALHHLGHQNWSGMAKLLQDGVGKLAEYRPFAQGIDIDAMLDDLSPWQDLAAARTGRAPIVTRIPDELPRLVLQ